MLNNYAPVKECLHIRRMWHEIESIFYDLTREAGPWKHLGDFGLGS